MSSWQEYIQWDKDNHISEGLETFTEEDVLVLGLVGGVTEAAEALDVGKKLKWHHHPYSMDHLAHIIEELGDMDWYRSITLRWLALCFDGVKDWKPDEIQELITRLSQKKLEARYSEGWTPEQSISRSKEINILHTVIDIMDDIDHHAGRSPVQFSMQVDGGFEMPETDATAEAWYKPTPDEELPL